MQVSVCVRLYVCVNGSVCVWMYMCVCVWVYDDVVFRAARRHRLFFFCQHAGICVYTCVCVCEWECVCAVDCMCVCVCVCVCDLQGCAALSPFLLFSKYAGMRVCVRVYVTESKREKENVCVYTCVF